MAEKSSEKPDEEPNIPSAKVTSRKRLGRHKPHRRTIKNFLLDRRLQLRYIVTITAISAVIAGVLGFLIWRQGAETTDDVVANIERTYADDQGLSDDVARDLNSNDNQLVLKMVGFGCALALILSLFLLILTHKVAGPLFKLSTHFDDLARGTFREVRSLRRFDMLHRFHRKFEDAHAAMRASLEADIAVMEAVVASVATPKAISGQSAAPTEASESTQTASEAFDASIAALAAHIVERKRALE